MFKQYSRLDPKRILVVRSSAKLFPAVCTSLRDTFPAAEIDVLTNAEALPESSLAEMITTVYRSATTGHFLFRDVKVFKKEVALKEYSLAIVLYNSRKGLSYLNIDSFAFASGAAKVLAVNIDGDIFEITRLVYLHKWLHRIGACVWVGINCLMSVLSLSVIFLALCVSVPFIMIAKMLSHTGRSGK